MGHGMTAKKKMRESAAAKKTPLQQKRDILYDGYAAK